MKLLIFIVFLGAVLLFVGDMFLYYDQKHFDCNDIQNSIYRIMKKVRHNRLYICALLGRLASFLSIVGILSFCFDDAT